MNRHEMAAPSGEADDTQRLSVFGLPARRGQTLFVVLLLFTWEGFFAAVLGQGFAYFHRQPIGIVILALSLLRLLQVARSGQIGRLEILSYVLFGWCVAVSAYSNAFLFPQPYERWVFALYGVAPCLLLPSLTLLGIRAEELFNGLVIAGVFGSLIVVVDQVVPIRFMDIFVRGASVEIERRVVFLKTEAACAAVILMARFGAAKTLPDLVRSGLLLLIVAINLAVVTESRLALVATAIGAAITLLWAFRGKPRLRLLTIGGAVVICAFPFVFWKYIEQAMSYTDYAAEDVSVSWRIQTYNYFLKYFEQTGGLGFGVMSTGADAGNFISWANNYAGIYAGIGPYPMLLVDVGITAAMLQFGYIGLALTVLMTLIMAFRLMGIGRLKDAELFALGALTLGYLLSPLPMNFFTLDWSNMTGNIIWSIAALCSSRLMIPTASSINLQNLASQR